MSQQETGFDRLTRALGARSSRRKTMTRLGGAGLAVALGASQLQRAAADDDLGVSCTQSISGTIATGDFAGAVFEGTLAFSLQQGLIDDGSFTVTGSNVNQLPALVVGAVYPLVGSAEGRAIHLRIAVEEGRFLTLEGTGQNELTACGDDMAGTFGGPLDGVLGTWLTFVDAQPPPQQPTQPPIPTTPPIDPTVEPTQVVCDPKPDCGVTFVLDEASCMCVCPGNNEKCGPVCCPGGSVCMDEASGTCSCPDGTEICGDLCVESCQPNYALNDACMCEEVV